METFPNLKHLAAVIPPMEPLHPVVKSEVVPMKILFKDEKYKSATIEILSRLLVDTCLSGNQQVNNGSNGHCYGAVHYLESNTLVFTVSLHVPLVTHAQSNWLIGQ